MSHIPGSSAGPVSGGRTVKVVDVVRQVIADTAPAELPLVDSLGSADGKGAARLLARRKRRREPLGFGLGDVAVLITPVAWVAVDEAARHGTDGVLAGLRALFGRIFRKPAPRVLAVPLPPDQLKRVHARVLGLAAQAGLEAGQAETLADRVVAKLVLEPATESAESD